MKTCIGCQRCRHTDLFALGRPRIDGSRHIGRFCVDCISQREAGVPAEERRLVRRMANRESRLRRRIATGRWA